MGPFDEARMATALLAVSDVERGVRYHIDVVGSPAEMARGWEAYRGAVSLRKALERWGEMRRWRAAHAGECESEHAETA